MMRTQPRWAVELACDARGRSPVATFVRKQGDARLRALIIRKMEHLARIAFDDMGRPLVDTLRGAIKELVVDKQVRVLFSCERAKGLLLMLEAARKKNGHGS